MAHRMSNAPVVPIPVGAIRQHEGIRVNPKADRVMVGSCNACTTITKNPDAYTHVTEVHLRGLSLRLCPACCSILKLAL